MNIFELFGQCYDYSTSYLSQGNKRVRQLLRMDKKAQRGVRQFAGYRLKCDECLTSAQLTYVFLPDSQSTAEAYAKLVSLGKDEKYSLLLLWCWATELGKTSCFISLPEIK